MLAIDRVHVERKLMGFYFEFWTLLKDISGNSGGFTGFSEYLFLRFLVLDLQKQLGLEFKTEEFTRDTRKFIAGDLIVLHGCDISKEIKGFPSMFPDLLVIQSLPNNKKKLLATLEIKIYFSDKKVLKNDLDRLRTINRIEPESGVYMVSFSDQYMQELEKFQGELPDRYGVILKNRDCRFSISFEKVIDIIIEKANKNRIGFLQY